MQGVLHDPLRQVLLDLLDVPLQELDEVAHECKSWSLAGRKDKLREHDAQRRAASVSLGPARVVDALARRLEQALRRRRLQALELSQRERRLSDSVVSLDSTFVAYKLRAVTRESTNSLAWHAMRSATRAGVYTAS